MRVQLWSYNFAPEPTGLAPLSAALSRLLIEREWEVDVVAAHPHYPEPVWGQRLRPYREAIDGAQVLRLPIWAGRGTAARRVRQEASFAVGLLAAIPLLGRPMLARPDVLVATSPSFPALLPGILQARLRRLPMVLWLQDVLPDGAIASGLLEEGPVVRASRRLERAAYSAADRVAVISRPFVDNLERKGVSREKLRLIHNPATRGVPDEVVLPDREKAGPVRVLSIGNIGLTQGLPQLVRAFENSETMKRLDVRLVITGTGVEASAVENEIRSSRVELLGVVADGELERELRSASLALVSQSYAGTEFNLPQKLMNFMAYGLPVIAVVDPSREIARIVRESRAGWIVDSSRPEGFPVAIEEALGEQAEMQRRGAAGRRFALQRFSPEVFGDAFADLLLEVVER